MSGGESNSHGSRLSAPPEVVRPHDARQPLVDACIRRGFAVVDEVPASPASIDGLTPLWHPRQPVLLSDDGSVAIRLFAPSGAGFMVLYSQDSDATVVETWVSSPQSRNVEDHWARTTLDATLARWMFALSLDDSVQGGEHVHVQHTQLPLDDAVDIHTHAASERSAFPDLPSLLERSLWRHVERHRALKLHRSKVVLFRNIAVASACVFFCGVRGLEYLHVLPESALPWLSFGLGLGWMVPADQLVDVLARACIAISIVLYFTPMGAALLASVSGVLVAAVGFLGGCARMRGRSEA